MVLWVICMGFNPLVRVCRYGGLMVEVAWHASERNYVYWNVTYGFELSWQNMDVIFWLLYINY